MRSPSLRPLLLRGLFVALALPLVTAAGCASHVRVLYQAEATPAPARTFVVEPLRFGGERVGRLDEKEWLARKTVAGRERWNRQEALLDARFTARLARRLPLGDGPGAYTIRPTVTELEPGWYGGVWSHATRVDLRVGVYDSSGRLVEELAADDTVSAHVWSPAAGPRLERAIDRLADRVASRVAPLAGPR